MSKQTKKKVAKRKARTKKRTHTQVPKKSTTLGRPSTKAAMGKAAREKGKRGELQACKLWQDAGYDAFRSVQHNGRSEKGEADIIIRGISDTFYPEVKNTETFSVFPVLKTAQREAGLLKTAFVMHTRNGQPFVVCLAAEDFISLLKRAGYVPPPKREIEL